MISYWPENIVFMFQSFKPFRFKLDPLKTNFNIFGTMMSVFKLGYFLNLGCEQ